MKCQFCGMGLCSKNSAAPLLLLDQNNSGHFMEVCMIRKMKFSPMGQGVRELVFLLTDMRWSLEMSTPRLGKQLRNKLTLM